MRNVVLIAMLALSVPAMADDLWPAPWDASLPNQTMQAWEVPQYPGGTVIPFGMQFEPTRMENPFGGATLTFSPGEAGPWPVTIEYVPDYHHPDSGLVVPTVHIGGPDGMPTADLVITIKNKPDENMKKLIFWQITSDKSPTPTGSGPTTSPPGTPLPSPYPQIQWPGGTWYTYNGLIEIRPNPAEETITFPGLVGSTNISEIVIKTVCVPEPATLGMAAAGALALLLRRRRRS